MSNQKPFYVTTPIYYANAELHIGHAFTTLAADTASRFQRNMGRETYFLTGSDEHGQKVEQAARARNISPIAHTDEMVAKFKNLWKKLEITHDDFIRTTEDRHKTAVRHVLTFLKEKGDIYEDTYHGWYCTPCERFWTEKEVPEKICPDCKRAIDTIEEKNYFFKMSKYQQQLIEYIHANPGFIRPENRRNEVLGFLAGPLNDLCVSRPKKRLTWGIEIPFDTDYVTYVWFDALTNYISAIGYPNDMPRFNKYWPASCHLIGKDILTTHSVYWSTMLMALGLPLPQMIFAHGWWISDGGKMSKSVGNVLNPLELMDRYGLDPFRFFLFREMVFGSDSVFSEDSFILRYNSDLANDLGNLCQRMLPMLIKHRNGTFVKGSGALHFPQTREIVELAEAVKQDTVKAMDNFLFHEALKRLFDLIGRLNKYVDETAPWALAKNQEFDKLDEVFYTIAEGIRIVSHLIEPFLPHLAPEFMKQIGLENSFLKIPELSWGQLPSGTKCGDPKPLFPRIDTPRIESLKQGKKKEEKKGEKKDDKGKATGSAEGATVAAAAATPAAITTSSSSTTPMTPAAATASVAMGAAKSPATASASGVVDYDEFMKTELCIAEVLTAEKVADTEKLLRLTVNIGTETRTLVAGIALYYKPEELVGTQVVVVKNLKPAKIRGIVSHGMILAAPTPDGGLSLVRPEKPSTPGNRVK